MNQNFKVFEDLYYTLQRQQENNIRNINTTKSTVATIVSVQGTTATISFGNETVQIPGIVIGTGVSVVAGNKVEIQNSTNGLQSSSYVITRKIAD